ncbi:succinate dehydrogenase assembly factor 2 [Orbilia ellipsospora]|uniref:Succinate dehydrogenase assembly factor 2, mitochondrial n=1 Tax=Orbilia ellipsospora TaxID=2528407 RepID=A0AAV9X4R6_9PEZI
MLPIRTVTRALSSRRFIPALGSQFSTTSYVPRPNRTDIPSNNDPKNPNQPHIPNASSTLGTDFPSVGKAPPPPEFIGSVDPKFAGNSQYQSGTTGKEGEVSGSIKPGHGSQNPSESEWAKFMAEPIKRVGEDEKTMRARLVYQSRKRGILETDLLLSTFADENLSRMTVVQMQEYDKFLDENDWDIYYWCTQDPPVNVNENVSSSAEIPAEDGSAVTEATTYNTSSSNKTASPVHPDGKIQPPPGVQHLGSIEQPMMKVNRAPEDIKGSRAIEWAQTVGSVKVAYKPVPEKWKNSWVLQAIRDHVESRRARPGSSKESATIKAKGMGRMPDLQA